MIFSLKLAYWLTAPAGLALFAVASLAVVSPRLRPTRWHVPPAGYLALLALTFCLWQWPIWRVQAPLDPDESQFLAGTITLHADPVFWRSVDGETAGPLVYYLLWFVTHAGGAAYGGARVVEAVLVLGTLAFSYLALSKVWGDGLARIALLPAGVFFIVISNPEFVHFSSEHVAIFLLAVAVYGLFSAFAGTAGSDRGLRPWLLAGLGLGGIPFAKLQAVGPAFGLFAVALVWIIGRRDREPGWHRRTLLAFAAGLFVVPAIFAAMLTAAGEWREFLLAYLAQNLVYTQGGWAGVHHALTGVRLLLKPVPSFYLLAIGSAVAAIGLGRSRRIWSGTTRWPLLLLLTWTLTTVPVCLGTRPFPHYLLFLVLPMTLLAGAIVAMAWPRSVSADAASPGGRLALAALALLVVPQFIVRAASFAPHLADPRSAYLSKERRSVAEATRIILDATTPGDRLTIWGWWDEPYVLTGLAQGTRHSNTDMLTMPGPYLDHLRQGYLSDLRDRRPRIFVDASGHGRAGTTHSGPRQLKSEMFAELRDYIATHYEFLANVGQVKIYRRKDS